MNLKEFDRSFFTKSVNLIAGVDEAGRGPLAGPVVAAAVVFNSEIVIPKINDSKKISEKLREELYEKIIQKASCYGIGIIDNEEIDKINILQATLKAMKIAVSNLSITPDLILIDGNKSFKSDMNISTVIKGDAKSFSIAAASILAKVTRDRIMVRHSKNHPEYQWQKNKGYGTKEHREAVIKFGATELHRKTFLRKIFEKQEEINFNAKL